MQLKPKNPNATVYVRSTLRQLSKGDLFINGHRDPGSVETGRDSQFALYMCVEPTPELLRGYQEKHRAADPCNFILAVNLRNGNMYAVGARDTEQGLDTECWRVDGEVQFAVRRWYTQEVAKGERRDS